MKKVADYLVDLASDDEKIRLNAVMELGDSDDEAAIAVLARFRADKNSAIRFYVKKSIMKLRTKFQNVSDDDLIIEISDETREKILKIKLIDKIKDRTKIDKLFSEFEEESDPLIKSTIVAVLGKLCDQSHLVRLVKFTENSDNRIVANAVEALESLNSEKTIEPLTRLLFHEDSRVKANVCKALWNFSAARKDIAGMVMARVKELISSDKPWIRSSAIFVLSTIKTPEAIEIIKSCRNDSEKIIRDQAVDTLKKLGYVETPLPQAIEELRANIEELPPDDFIPKIKFYVKKLFKKSSETIKEILSNPELRAVYTKKLARITLYVVLLLFFVTTFNAVWELLYMAPAKENKEASKLNVQTGSNAIFEAAGYLKELKFDECISRLEKELLKTPDDLIAQKLLAVAYNQKASELMKTSKNVEAAVLFEKAISLSPELSDAYLKYSRLLLVKNDRVKAQEIMKKGLAADPKNSSLNMQYSKMLIAASNYEDARVCLQKVVELEPANAMAHYYLAECLMALKEHDAARTAYGRATFLDPLQYDMRVKMANKFIENDFVFNAIGELSYLAQKNPKKIDLRKKLGDIYFQTSNYRGAADEFKAVLKEAPNDYEINFKAALCFQALDNVDEMFRYSYNAVKLNAEFSPAYYTLGSVYEYKKMLPAAKTCYDKVIKLTPSNPDGYIAMAALYLNSSQDSSAVLVLQSGLKALPDHPKILYNLGMAYLRQKDNKNARDVFTKLLGVVGNEKETAEYKKVVELISKL